MLWNGWFIIDIDPSYRLFIRCRYTKNQVIVLITFTKNHSKDLLPHKTKRFLCQPVHFKQRILVRTGTKCFCPDSIVLIITFSFSFLKETQSIKLYPQCCTFTNAIKYNMYKETQASFMGECNSMRSEMFGGNNPLKDIKTNNKIWKWILYSSQWANSSSSLQHLCHYTVYWKQPPKY